MIVDTKASDSGKEHDSSEQSDMSLAKSDASFDPPPYTPSEAGPSEPRSTFQPRVNHLYVYEHNRSIKGEWVVDTSLKIPQSLLPEIPEGEERQNLKVESHNGGTTAEIKLLGASDSKARALLDVSSHNGSTFAYITSRQGQKFLLKARSHNGSVTVKLPADFQGPITFFTCNGGVNLSPRVQQKLVTFSKSRKDGKAFVGDWEAAGFGEGEHSDWKGDELDIGTKNGSVNVGFNDELTSAEMFAKTFKKEGAFAAMGQAFRGTFGKSKGGESTGGWYDARTVSE